MALSSREKSQRHREKLKLEREQLEQRAAWAPPLVSGIKSTQPLKVHQTERLDGVGTPDRWQAVPQAIPTNDNETDAQPVAAVSNEPAPPTEAQLKASAAGFAQFVQFVVGFGCEAFKEIVKPRMPGLPIPARLGAAKAIASIDDGTVLETVGAAAERVALKRRWVMPESEHKDEIIVGVACAGSVAVIGVQMYLEYKEPPNPRRDTGGGFLGRAFKSMTQPATEARAAADADEAAFHADDERDGDGYEQPVAQPRRPANPAKPKAFDPNADVEELDWAEVGGDLPKNGEERS